MVSMAWESVARTSLSTGCALSCESVDVGTEAVLGSPALNDARTRDWYFRSRISSVNDSLEFEEEEDKDEVVLASRTCELERGRIAGWGLGGICEVL